MKIRIGTRGSKLALVQAREVGSLLESQGAEVLIEVIKTVGDTLDVALPELGGKGVFVKEIDEALLGGTIDIAVHSMKDVPANLPAGISIAAVPIRKDPSDAFISTVSHKLSGLPKGSRVGTSSPRRRAQLFKLRPDLDVLPMRGNVETRLKKLDEGEVDALILASSGLLRLGIGNVITERLPHEKMIPAIGQGALAVETRSDDRELIRFVNKACHHNVTGIAIRAERTFLKTFGGDCYTPLAAHAVIHASGLVMSAFAAAKDEAHCIIDKESGSPAEAAEIGARLAKRMMEKL